MTEQPLSTPHRRLPRRLSWGASFALVLLPLLDLILSAGTLWKADLGLYALNLALGAVFAGLVVAWLLYFRPGRLPALPFALPALALFAWMLFATLRSPDPRMGVSRLLLFAFYGLFLTLYVLAGERLLDRSAMAAALIAAGGFVLVAAAGEVASRYIAWWRGSGTFSAPPGPYRLVSVVGHANIMMMYVNLCAPFAVVALRFWRKPAARMLSAAWLGLYLLALPFTSSRGGWLGALTWAAVMAAFWVGNRGLAQVVSRYWTRRPLWLRAGGLVALGLALAAGWRVLAYFNQHASHGGEGASIASSRAGIWLNALHAVLASPLVGSGAGRFPFAYLEASRDVPPGFWAIHAHSLPIQFAAEFGLPGLALLAVLAGMMLSAGWKRVRAVKPYRARWWSAAAFSALLGVSVHSLFEDTSRLLVVMLPLLLVYAFVLTSAPAPLPRARLSARWLFAPALALLVVGGWLTWTYQPMSVGLAAAKEGRWRQAATLISLSAQRDPAYSFYQAQAGLAWARAYEQSGDRRDLQQARLHFSRSLALEPAVAQWWANLAVLDWQAGERAEALVHFQRAITLAPREPSFYLNLAWMQESMGATAAAFDDYNQALSLAPGLSRHPFFRETKTRVAARAAWAATSRWQGNDPAAGRGSACWQQGQAALAAGNLPQAQNRALCSGWLDESPVARDALSGEIAEALGDRAGALAAYQRVLAAVEQARLVNSPTFVDYYTQGAHEHAGLNFDLVPGYLRLVTDSGEQQALRQLSAWYRQDGQLEQMAQANRALERLAADGAP